MKVLVTGAAGYIGSHICVALLEAGHQIVVLDNFCNSSPTVFDRVKTLSNADFAVERADVRDGEKLQKILTTHIPEAVIHLAGLKSVKDSVRSPLDYYETNLSGSIALLRACHDQGVRKVLFSSSATVYSDACTSPISEAAICSPYNPYGQSKYAVERCMADIAASHGAWSMMALRYFNPVGAHPSGLIGEDPAGVPSNLCPLITQVASGQRDTLEIFGNDYPTRDGTGERDYIHVMDLAEGHVLALNRVALGNGFECINLGCGRGHTVLEVHAAFEKITGKHIPYTMNGRRPGDIASYFADPTKAEHLLGWRAKRDLLDMARDAWRWQLLSSTVDATIRG